MTKRSEIVIRSSTFKYPSKDERRTISKEYPKVPHLIFSRVLQVSEIFSSKISLPEVARINNLFYWNIFLSNRLSLIRESYEIAIANYNRSASNPTEATENEKRFANRWKFDYYSETFYYFFFSFQDQLAGFLNLFFFDEYEESRGLYLNEKFISRIPDKMVKEAINLFLSSTDRAKELRNAFTHRFSPTAPDFRITVTNVNGKKYFGIGSGDSVSAEVIVANMRSSVDALSELMGNLSGLVKE